LARTKGSYVTRGRGLELEKEIARVHRELSERVAAAEARAIAAEARANTIYEVLVEALTKRPTATKRKAA
jgi:hypothetical protein